MEYIDVAISEWTDVAIRDVVYKQRKEHLTVRAQGLDVKYQHSILCCNCQKVVGTKLVLLS